MNLKTIQNVSRKALYGLVGGIMAAGLWSCSSEEDVSSGTGELGEPQFLTVNLVTNSTSTRATGDPNKSEYEEGLTGENEVTKVRFYFFDEDGNPAVVKKDGSRLKNYLEWTAVTEDKDENPTPNVEKILTTTLIIQSPEGDAAPAQVVAIVNPSQEPNEERSLMTLANVANDYATPECTKSGGFVMSNTTYAVKIGENTEKQMAVSVEGKVFKTSGEALNNPLQIYVERVIAKVRLNSDLAPAFTDKPNIFKTSADGSQKVTVMENDVEVEKEIYVQFLGWNTTAVADRSRLVKDINPHWRSNLFGDVAMPWNWADYFRSFWAINANGVNYQYGAFIPNTESNTIDDNLFNAQAKKRFDKSDWVYVNENASPYASSNTSNGDDPATKTKVIISAQLVDKDGNPLEFAEYGSTRTTIDGLKQLFANNCGLYKKETVAGQGTKFTKITPDELTIKTATELGLANQNVKGRYKVYVQLKTDEENKWYASTSETATAISAKAANEQLQGLGSAKVWKDGYTYYYFDINHIGTKFGVVRNHIYDANITSLSGLGTPVYKPDEIIYPEKPDKDEDTFIAAKIRILTWRIVKSDVSLDW